MVVGLIWRAGVVYAVIVVTRNYGVWDSPDVAQDVYADAVEYIEPFADKARRQLNICPPRPPPEGELPFFGIHYYNQLVKAFFDILSVVPAGMVMVLENVPAYFTALVESIRRLIQSKKKEITISKGQLDETPLVRPHCKDKNCPKTPLIPPGNRRYRDDFIYEQRKARKSTCECAKCKQRPREKWPNKECASVQDAKKSNCACGETAPRQESIKSCKECLKKPQPKE